MASATAPRRFAEGTKVTSSTTMDSIEKLLKRYGADDFAIRRNPHAISVMFNLPDSESQVVLRIRYTVYLPSEDDLARMPIARGRHTSTRRTPAEIESLKEKETARLWRALLRTIEGKLIGVAEKIETLEQAFYAHIIVTPQGTTLYEESHGRLIEQYKTGRMLELLPALPTAPISTNSDPNILLCSQND